MVSKNGRLEEIGKFLLHIKALIWCLCKATERYNLNKIVKALRQRKIPNDLLGSTVGQNLNVIFGALEDDDDYETLIEALKVSVNDIQKRGGKKAEVHHPSGLIICEVGHYIKAVKDIGDDISPGSFGVLSALRDNRIVGLFFVEDKGLRLVECKPGKVQFIFGTTIFSPAVNQ